MVLVRNPSLVRIAFALCLFLGCAASVGAVAQDDPEPRAGAAAQEKPGPQGAVESQLPPGINVTFETMNLDQEGNYEFTGNVTILWRDSRIQADRPRVSGSSTPSDFSTS